MKEYPYFNAELKEVTFDLMLSTISRDAVAGDVILLHACCHNPTGADLSIDQWTSLANLISKKGLVPFVDNAYQGLNSGMDKDAEGIRILAKTMDEVLIANSCSKNFGLYRERTGAAVILTSCAKSAELVQNRLNRIVRSNYSTPPSYGAMLVQIILDNAELKKCWENELIEMRDRIKGLRKRLTFILNEIGVDRDFSFIEKQNGLFSFMDLTQNEVEILRQKYHIYMISSGRANIAGLNEKNIGHFSQALKEVIST